MASRAPHQSPKRKMVDNSKAVGAEIVEAVEPCLPLPLEHQQEAIEAAITDSPCQQELIEPIFTASIAVDVTKTSWLNHRSPQNVVTHVF